MSAAKHKKAQVVPFSSVVGSSVTLHDPETGHVVSQLSVLNTGGETPEDFKQRQIAVADDVASRINSHDEMLAALKDAKRFIEYFAGETNNTFVGEGTPKTCLAGVRAAIAKATGGAS